MSVDSPFSQIEVDDFARRMSMRQGTLMWLLGAGASAAAGVPTATDMIWEFKQQLYVSQRRVPLALIRDLTNPAVRAQLQSYIEVSGKFSPLGAPDEYAALFEAVWPNEQDRRTYIDGKLSGAKPSYGHIALATLMKAGLVHLVWTTNFDALVADACASVFGSTAALTTIALDAPDLARDAINARRWPVEIKLHGDFRSRRLKNTTDELKQQDAKLRQVFEVACQTHGVVVAGYSGRDESIMKAFSKALDMPSSFPAGLFWLHRGDTPPPPSVSALLTAAKSKEIDGGLVRIENFDETLRDIVRLTGGLDTSSIDAFASDRKIWSPASRAGGSRGFPVIRLNALPVDVYPTVCRRIVCKIGGHSEVRSAVEESNVQVLVGRTKAGVVAFGTDSDVRKAFDRFGISEFDLHPIEARRLRYDSGERGLLRWAMSQALSRELDLTLMRHRSTDLLFPTDPMNKRWIPLKQMVGGNIHGSVHEFPDLQWHEGIGVRLDWAEDRLWLVFEPRIVFEGVPAEYKAAAADFARERTVRRYNRQLNQLIDFWSSVLAHGGKDLSALCLTSGVDAVFHLPSQTAYSRRAGA